MLARWHHCNWWWGSIQQWVLWPLLETSCLLHDVTEQLNVANDSNIFLPLSDWRTEFFFFCLFSALTYGRWYMERWAAQFKINIQEMALSSHSESKSHIVTSSVQYPFQYPGKSYQEHHDTSSTQTTRVLEHSEFRSHSFRDVKGSFGIIYLLLF